MTRDDKAARLAKAFTDSPFNRPAVPASRTRSKAKPSPAKLEGFIADFYKQAKETNSRASAHAGRPPRKGPKAPPLENGWYQIGVPKQKYSVDELLQHWRFLWNKHRNTELPAYNWHLRIHLHRWLVEQTPEKVEAVFEYAFANWEKLRKKHGIEIEAPYLGALVMFRRTLAEAYSQSTGTKPKKWGAHWNADTEDAEVTYGEDTISL